jgi:hypothetical protein
MAVRAARSRGAIGKSFYLRLVVLCTQAVGEGYPAARQVQKLAKYLKLS